MGTLLHNNFFLSVTLCAQFTSGQYTSQQSTSHQTPVHQSPYSSTAKFTSFWRYSFLPKVKEIQKDNYGVRDHIWPKRERCYAPWHIHYIHNVHTLEDRAWIFCAHIRHKNDNKNAYVHNARITATLWLKWHGLVPLLFILYFCWSYRHAKNPIWERQSL